MSKTGNDPPMAYPFLLFDPTLTKRGDFPCDRPANTKEGMMEEGSSVSLWDRRG
jgi:hypothetical protein